MQIENLFSINTKILFLLALLFRRKSRAIVIARSSSLSSALYKIFNVAHNSKSIKGINTTNLEYLLIIIKVQLQDEGA